MRYEGKFVTLACILCVLTLADCGGGGSSGGTADGVPDADGKVPFEVLKAGIMAGNSGDYDAAAKWVSSTGMQGDNYMLWQKATNNGTVSKVEMTDEEYRGQEVAVGYILHFEDGSTKKDRASMVKVGGRWKIDWLSTGFNF